MADWRQTVKIGDLHGEFEDGGISVQEVAARLADRLEGSLIGDDLRDDGTLETLRDIGSVEEYDECLENIYDWADRKRVWLDPT